MLTITFISLYLSLLQKLNDEKKTFQPKGCYKTEKGYNSHIKSNT